jgi:adenylate cyclase
LSAERVERRLAAILAADVAGYSRLMGLDEAGTLARLNALRRALIDPQVAEHKGRIVKTTGDGILIEFPSVVEAVACALGVQKGMASRNAAIPQNQRIEFRIGINTGDVIVEDGDIHGDGVNIAARLEALAEPGMICVSAIVQSQVQGRLDCAFEDQGEQNLKNIARPVRVYRVGPRASRPHAAGTAAVPSLALPDKPSIAVLPFQNMSGDPEQEYFADGMVEEIITSLSRIRWLFVIARNSCFTYKGQAVDVKRVGRELGVRYVLEGSVRKGGNRVRITAQLIEAETGAHLWAERFDGSMEDVFDLQDQVAVSVAGVIEPTLQAAEIRRSAHRPTDDLTAYDLYLRALPHWASCEKDRLLLALDLLAQATACDPYYGAAYGVAADCCVLLDPQLAPSEQEANRREGIELARRAIQTGADDPHALANAAGVFAVFGEEIGTSISLIDRVLELNPGHAPGWEWSGYIRVFAGEPELAIKHFETSLRLSPRSPFAGVNIIGTGMAHFLARRFDEAIGKLRVGLEQAPSFAYGYPLLAASYAHSRRLDAARQALARLRAAVPGADPTDVSYLRRAEDRELVLSGLRLAMGETG